MPGRAIITSVDLMNGDRVLAAPELERADRVGGDHGGQRLIAHAQADLSQQTVDANFVDESPQPVPRAQTGQRLVISVGGPAR